MPPTDLIIDKLPDAWTPHQRSAFARVYRHMLACQAAFVHPEAPAVDAEYWSTTCWNAAWLAASYVEADAPRMIHLDGDDNLLCVEPEAQPLRLN